MDSISLICLYAATGLAGYFAGRRRGRALALREHVIEALQDGPAHGAVISQRIADRRGYTPSAGSLYLLLRSMERSGELLCMEEPGGIERGYRPRFVYSLCGRYLP